MEHSERTPTLDDTERGQRQRLKMYRVLQALEELKDDSGTIEELSAWELAEFTGLDERQAVIGLLRLSVPTTASGKRPDSPPVAFLSQGHPWSLRLAA